MMRFHIRKHPLISKTHLLSGDGRPAQPVEINAGVIMGNADLIGRVVLVRGHIQQVDRTLDTLAAMGDPGWNPECPRRLQITHQKIHRLLVGSGVWAHIAEPYPQNTGHHIPPIGLNVVKMPGLDYTVEHERVAPLADPPGKKLIAAPDNFAEKTAFIDVGHQLFDFNSLNHPCISPKTYHYSRQR